MIKAIKYLESGAWSRVSRAIPGTQHIPGLSQDWQMWAEVHAEPQPFQRRICSGSSLCLQLSLKYLQEPGLAGVFENTLASDLLITFDLIEAMMVTMSE